ncbi:hypothetical protein C8R45DRAFT_1097063 [Mycena sanguinolenta]|nr:hypothetical protein C8R45DRAFT_1097063 [Mycena sanguinolenta]
MSSTLFHFVALWLSLSICASALAPALGALAPRASAAPIPSYRPPWQCPASYTAGTNVYPVVAAFVRTATYSTAIVDAFICETTLLSCYYDLNTGLVQPITGLPEWCGPGLQPNSGCAYECPLSNGIATDSVLSASTVNYTSGSTVVDKLTCYYGTNKQTGTGSSYDASCTYDLLTGKTTTAGTSKSAETCQGPLTLDCGSTTTRRRRYRKEDTLRRSLRARRCGRANVPLLLRNLRRGPIRLFHVSWVNVIDDYNGSSWVDLVSEFTLSSGAGFKNVICVTLILTAIEIESPGLLLLTSSDICNLTEFTQAVSLQVRNAAFALACSTNKRIWTLRTTITLTLRPAFQ